MFLSEKEPENAFSLLYRATEEKKLLARLVADAIVDIKPEAAPVRIFCILPTILISYCASADYSVKPSWLHRKYVVENSTKEVSGLPRPSCK